MVESQAFFEAYRYVLEALKEIGPGALPFEEHIVECSKVVGPPDHEHRTNGYYNMSGILQDGVDGVSDWAPTATMTAILALQKAFCRQRTKVCRHSRAARDWEDVRGFEDRTCSFADSHALGGRGGTVTNLDGVLHESRFGSVLEGLLPMTGIVRVGGRSKSEKLEPCMLRFLREQARESKEIPGRIARAKTKARRKMREMRENGQLELSITVLKFSRRGILSFHVLKQFMSERHAKWFEREFERKRQQKQCYRSVLRMAWRGETCCRERLQGQRGLSSP
ncbi:NFX1-type zinc finger-containing protein 1 [Desmophyllum pertusum]|uniref:NFX1-type zinc finger-containing protein 1 n=1 Tax=Desmophyllum pertusum TaxID=174260 RepID=A0A9W9ZF59_9CNID|nr:NFX1-type zinc finger-containing protein 1 [Desmophyllum pertusum]